MPMPKKDADGDYDGCTPTARPAPHHSTTTQPTAPPPRHHNDATQPMKPVGPEGGRRGIRRDGY